LQKKLRKKAKFSFAKNFGKSCNLITSKPITYFQKIQVQLRCAIVRNQLNYYSTGYCWERRV